MDIALQLAKQGAAKVAPNPMVGCLVVNNNTIVGQGFHEQHGGPHAEVNAIANIEDKTVLKNSTLYVTLEPCAHFGKTPPCADFIIAHHIPKVVIACVDTFSEVSGKGIDRLKAAGITVTVGVLEKQAQELNKTFFTFHTKKRPYIILKWAETKDGFIDIERPEIANSGEENVKQYFPKKEPLRSLNSKEIDNWITTPESKKLVHFWRSETQAIMVGTNTAFNDNPQLTVRETDGENPLRVVLDLNLRLPKTLHLFDQSVPTIVLNYQKNETLNNLEFIQLDARKELATEILKVLYLRDIQSLIIEGGAQLLRTFITQNIWDEARVFTGKKEFKTGLEAPQLNKEPKYTRQIDTDSLSTYFNA
jgi:diaminohydroxyphosphoribosylaminopyrimidine deaminase/5-amino-6-(5-phosphoribosylamino)uracil reductase